MELVCFAKAHRELAEASQETAEDDDTPASRFVSRLLKHLVKGLEAKNKMVRYRCINIIAEMMAHLGEVECVFIPTVNTSLSLTLVFAVKTSTSLCAKACLIAFKTKNRSFDHMQ